MPKASYNIYQKSFVPSSNQPAEKSTSDRLSIYSFLKPCSHVQCVSGVA